VVVVRGLLRDVKLKPVARLVVNVSLLASSRKMINVANQTNPRHNDLGPRAAMMEEMRV
jgi:hypothetical protein